MKRAVGVCLGVVLAFSSPGLGFALSMNELADHYSVSTLEIHTRSYGPRTPITLQRFGHAVSRLNPLPQAVNALKKVLPDSVEKAADLAQE